MFSFKQNHFACINDIPTLCVIKPVYPSGTIHIMNMSHREYFQTYRFVDKKTRTKAIYSHLKKVSHFAPHKLTIKLIYYYMTQRTMEPKKKFK